MRADDQTLTDEHAEETMQSVLKALKDAGVPEKFIILKINNQSVRTVADVEKLFKSAQNSEEQTLWIYGKTPAGQQRSFAVLLSDE